MKSPSLPDVVDARKLQRVRSGMPTEEAVSEAIEVFGALANPMRLRLLHALSHDELCVGDLAHALGFSMSAVSHQLALLRHLRLVAAREEGRQTYYRAIDEAVSRLVHDCLALVGGTKEGKPHRHPHRARRER